MWRYLVLIFISIKMCSAVNSIGITTLFYPSSSESQSISISSSESNLTDIERKFNQVMITQIKTQIPKITPLLKQTLIESGTFNVFDGNKTLSNWGALESGLITKWQLESSSLEMQVIDNMALESDTKVKSSNISNKYLLIGFIKSIDAHEVKQVFSGTTNTSILYSLNIEITYKLIDMDTKEVFSDFIATGHGGFARIISTNFTHMSQTPENVSDDIINDAINSLVINVKHGLLVKEGLGVMPH